MELTYGSNTALTVDTSKLPQVSIDALLRRGWSHLMGSEASSKALGQVPKADGEGKERTTTAKAFQAALLEAQTGNVKALTDGTIGTRMGSVGPRGSKLETVIRALAKGEVTNALASIGVSFPAKADDKVTFESGESLTGSEMIARRIAKHGERLTKEAEKKMADEARKAAKVQEATVAAGGAKAGASILD